MRLIRPRLSLRDHGQYKAAFDAWLSEGTLPLAAAKLKREGVVSFKGTPYAPAGVRWGAMRYMVMHYEEAMKIMFDNYAAHGYKIDQVHMERYFIQMARTTFGSNERLKNWLIEHDLMEKHRKFIDSLATFSE